MHIRLLIKFALLLVMCSCVCRSNEYRQFYAHLHRFHATQKMEPADYFLVILVDARHLDYTDGSKFFHSVQKHPSDCSKNGDVGHAWIYLQGVRDGKIVAIEGGHSGEIEAKPPRYFDGLMNYCEWGYADPTPEEKACIRFEANPIKYLWTAREDGFFQKGAGGHVPTFAVKVTLTEKQFDDICQFIKHYPFKEYALMGPQCSTFVAEVAERGGLSLESQAVMQVAPRVFFGRCWVRLWEDPDYSILTIPTPDVLERSLIRAVERGQAEDALAWYKNRSKS